jgi:hypothetical protein
MGRMKDIYTDAEMELAEAAEGTEQEGYKPSEQDVLKYAETVVMPRYVKAAEARKEAADKRISERAQLAQVLSDDELLQASAIALGQKSIDDYPTLYDKIFNYYFNLGEIPYGTAKARDGDPYEWVQNRLEYVFREKS